MTRPTELLAQRAERGQPRGADTVWAAARQRSTPAPARPTRADPAAVWSFRLALAAWVIAVGVGGLMAGTDGSAAPPRAVTAGQSTPADPASPDPILIDGMSLVGVFPPRGSGSCCQDDLYDRFMVRVEGASPITTTGQPAGATRWQVFADPADPFAGPILGIEILAGGGFRPWGVNVDEQALSDLVDRLTRRDGSWTIDPDTGLEPVADFTDDSTRFLFGWQFDFERGAETATWQAEPDRGAGVWLWLARMVAGRDATTLAASPVAVLDQTGLAIGIADEPSEVIWEHDELVYRLTASRIVDDTAVTHDPLATAAQLRLADRADWVAAVDQAGQRTMGSGLAVAFLLVATIAAVASAGFFLVKGPRPLGLLGLLPVVPWLVISSSGRLDYPTALLAAVGLAWWYRHRTRVHPGHASMNSCTTPSSS